MNRLGSKTANNLGALQERPEKRKLNCQKQLIIAGSHNQKQNTVE